MILNRLLQLHQRRHCPRHPVQQLILRRLVRRRPPPPGIHSLIQMHEQLHAVPVVLRRLVRQHVLHRHDRARPQLEHLAAEQPQRPFEHRRPLQQPLHILRPHVQHLRGLTERPRLGERLDHRELVIGQPAFQPTLVQRHRQRLQPSILTKPERLVTRPRHTAPTMPHCA